MSVFLFHVIGLALVAKMCPEQLGVGVLEVRLENCNSFSLCMRSVDTRQVLGCRLDDEPGTR